MFSFYGPSWSFADLRLKDLSPCLPPLLCTDCQSFLLKTHPHPHPCDLSLGPRKARFVGRTGPVSAEELLSNGAETVAGDVQSTDARLRRSTGTWTWPSARCIPRSASGLRPSPDFLRLQGHAQNKGFAIVFAQGRVSLSMGG